jgi:hypothetical protein
MVQDILKSAWRKPGGGINDPEGSAKKNRASIKTKTVPNGTTNEEDNVSEEEASALDYFTALSATAKAKYLAMLQNEELRESLEGFGFSSENQQRVEELFNRRVEESASVFKNKLGQLLQESSPSPFLSDKQINVVELLAERINELEAAIAYCENENENLIEEIKRKEAKQTVRKERTPKKSVVAEYMEFVDESNSELMREEPYVDPRMKSYIDAIKRTTQH